MARSQKRWDELTADEKADLVHRENRQLHDLLNDQARQIDNLRSDIEKIKKALERRQILID